MIIEKRNSNLAAIQIFDYEAIKSKDLSLLAAFAKKTKDRTQNHTNSSLLALYPGVTSALLDSVQIKPWESIM